MRSLAPLPIALIASLAGAATYPMTMHTVVDDQGTHGVAYRYLAPKGWKVDAKLLWSDRILQPTVFSAEASSPDGRFGYSTFGGMDFAFGGVTGSHQFYGYQQGSKQGVEPPAKLTDFMAKVVEGDKSMSDVRITRRVDRPLSQGELPWANRRYGMASELDYTFVKNGRTLEGVSVARMDVGLAGDPRQEMQAYNGDWEITDAYSVYSPPGEGKKAMRFFSLAVPTYTPTRAFLMARGAYILALNHQIQEQIRSIGEMSRISAGLSRDRQDAIMGNYRSQQAAQNKAVSGFCDFIGDVDRYRTADGSEMQLASGYKDAWTNRAGDVVLSDNAGYDPNQGSGGGWTRLKKG